VPDVVVALPLETKLEPDPTGEPVATADPVVAPKGKPPLVSDPLVSTPDPPTGGGEYPLPVPALLPPLRVPLPVPLVAVASGAATLPACSPHPQSAPLTNTASVEHNASYRIRVIVAASGAKDSSPAKRSRT
jgi:hypothetical protein